MIEMSESYNYCDIKLYIIVEIGKDYIAINYKQLAISLLMELQFIPLNKY